MNTDLAIIAQVELVKRMREVRSALPKWWTALDQEVAIAQDAECQRLLTRANRAWETRHSREALGLCTTCGTRHAIGHGNSLCGACDEMQEAM